MKRIIVVAAALAVGAEAAEQLPMEHVLVSVPIHKREAETALPVTVLSGEELRRQAATTLGETLGSKPGLANASFGPGVGRPVIRGQQGPRAIVLQNGTQSADVSSLSPDHTVAVEALLADSIEVLRGPATLLYGGGAIGGVVNVIDNRIPRTPIDGVDGAVEYRYDAAPDMDSGVFRLEGGDGAFAFHLSGTARETNDLEIPGLAIDEQAIERQQELLGGHGEEEGDEAEEETENTDGFIANTDSETKMFTGGLSYHLGEEGFAGLSVSYLDSEYGIPPGAHGEEHGEEGEDAEVEEEEEEAELIRLDVEQIRYDAMVHLHDPMPGMDIMRLFVAYTDYEHMELEGAETGTMFERDTWETRLELVHAPLNRLHGVFGLQWRNDDFEAVGEEAFVPQTFSDEVGLFLIEDFHFGDVTFEGGLRGDWVRRDPDAQRAGSEDFLSFSASASALWSISSQWTAGLAVSRTERAPATEELFSNIDATDPAALVTHAATGVIEIGDAGLNEEISRNVDLTFTWRGERSWAELALFYNRFGDYIFLANSGEEVDETPVFLYTQNDADFYGVEFESELHLFDAGGGELALGLTSDLVRAEFDEGGDVPRLPPRRLGAKLIWRADAWSTWVSVLDAGDQDDPGEFETATDGYTRWDLGADYTLRFGDSNELLAFLKWKNVGDEEIRLSTSFLRNVAPAAGQSVEAGLRYRF